MPSPTKVNKLVEKLAQLQMLESLIPFDQVDPKHKGLKLVRRTKSDVFEITSYVNVVCAYAEITSLFYTYRHSQNYQDMKSFFQHDSINGSIPNFVEEKQVLIRRSAFVDGNDRYEWRFAERYIPNQKDRILIITIYTLGNSHKHVITDIIATYTIREVSDIIHTNGDKTYNVMFTGRLINAKENLSKPSQEHLIRLATDIGLIPDIILKRRILNQQQIDLSKYKPLNSRCTNCLELLTIKRFKYLFSDPKAMCVLCGFNICKKCIIEKPYSSFNVGLPIMICRNCLSRVQFCNFSNIDQETDFNKIICDPDGYDAGKNAFNYLMSRSESFKYVISLILSKDIELTDTAWIRDLADYLTDHPSLDQCLVSTIGDPKAYPLLMLGDDIEGYCPIPNNEQQRLDAVETIDINKWSNNPELLKLCDLVAYDQRDVSMLVIVGSKTDLSVIASNNPATIATYPRRISFCQYVLMEGAPLLISNPESDMRFCRLSCVKENMIRTYFGVPVFHQGHIIGTLCIMSPIVRHISRSQYSLMLKLADVVSKMYKIDD